MTPETKSVADISWSHSALDQYRNCPFRYYRQRVAKDVKDDGKSPALEWGIKVHDALEHNLTQRRPMQGELAKYEEYADKVRSIAIQGGMAIEPEIEMAFNSAWERTSWFSKTAWFRCKADVFLRSEVSSTALVVDWKTNKRYYGESGQAELNAAAAFIYDPDVQQVGTAFVYLDLNKTVQKVFTRDQLPVLLTPSLQTLQDIARSYQQASWPKKPSGLCRFCPVADCEHR